MFPSCCGADILSVELRGSKHVCNTPGGQGPRWCAGCSRGLLGQTCTMQNHRKQQPPLLVMHITSQISCRALLRAHPLK